MAEVEIDELHVEISGLADMIGVVQGLLQDIIQRVSEQQRSPGVDPERLDRIDAALEALASAAVAQPGIDLETKERLVKAAKRLTAAKVDP